MIQEFDKTSKFVLKLISMTSLSNTAQQIRRDIVRMVHGVQSGHPG